MLTSQHWKDCMVGALVVLRCSGLVRGLVGKVFKRHNSLIKPENARLTEYIEEAAKAGKF